MATSFDSVIDMALVVIRDYKLTALYEQSEEDFKRVLDAYMLKGLPKFKTQCLKCLDYDVEAREFVEDLDNEEIDILADLAVISWYTDQLQDVLEFKEGLSNIDFKRLATGQNLKLRQEYLQQLRQRVKQDIVNYQFQHVTKMPYFNGNN